MWLDITKVNYGVQMPLVVVIVNIYGKSVQNSLGFKLPILKINFLEIHFQSSIQFSLKNYFLIDYCFFFSFFIKQCSEVFGAEYDYNSIVNNIQKTNENYGGLDYNGSRVIFVNGLIDPVRVFSFDKKRPNKLVKKILIENASHCEDMQPSLPSDSIELTNARQDIFLLIKRWLGK